MTVTTYDGLTASSFPQGLPIAKLTTVHLSKLLKGDAAESKMLLNACKLDGFFYLNIQNLEYDLLPVLDFMFQLDKELYDLPDEDKMAYDVDKLSDLKLNGYADNFSGLLRLLKDFVAISP